MVFQAKKAKLGRKFVNILKNDSEFLLYFLIITELTLQQIHEILDLKQEDLVRILQYNLLKSLCVNKMPKDLTKNDMFD